MAAGAGRGLFFLRAKLLSVGSVAARRLVHPTSARHHVIDCHDRAVARHDRDEIALRPEVGLVCDVIERSPRYENSGYTKQIVWWDKDEYRIQRIDFYDRKDTRLKTLQYHGYRQYAGEYWRPDRMTMENHQNGKNTELVFDEWSFGNGLSEGEFTPSRLRRTR